MGKRDFDNNLKYQGWEQMSTILDEEMPGKRRSKKLFFLIFLIPVLLFLVIYGTNIFGNKQQISNKFPVKTQSHKAINNTNNIKSYNTNTENNDQTIIEKSNTKISEKSSMKANSATKIKTNKTQKNNKTKHKQSKKIQTTKNDFALSNFNSSNSNAGIKPINTGLSNTSKNDYIANIAKLNSLSIQNLSTEQNIIYLSKINLRKHRNIDLFNPFAGIKMYIYSIKEPQTKFGLEIGNRFLYSTKFFTDISLAYTQSQIVVSQKDLKSSDIILSHSGKDSVVLNTINSNLRYGIFQFSLNQGYRFNTKFSTTIGVSLGYTKFVNKYDFDSSNSIEEKIDHIDIILDKFRYSSQINISYQILQNLSFNIGYKHYFSTIYKAKSYQYIKYSTTVKSKEKDFNTYIGVRLWF